MAMLAVKDSILALQQAERLFICRYVTQDDAHGAPVPHAAGLHVHLCDGGTVLHLCCTVTYCSNRGCKYPRHVQSPSVSCELLP